MQFVGSTVEVLRTGFAVEYFLPAQHSNKETPGS
jgi:hypothetical protein